MSACEATVLAQVWTGVGREGFVFPELRPAEAEGGVLELQAKPNFAVCISGGGVRATTCALGWIRILHRENLLKDARYLCSISGGSWFNAAFSYLPESHSAAEFLGEYVPPEELTGARAVASVETKSYGHAIVHAGFTKELVSNFAKERAQKWANWGKNGVSRLVAWLTNDPDFEANFVRFHSWARSVGAGFLLPFGMDVEGDGEEARVHLQVAYSMAGTDSEKRANEASGVTEVLTACRDPSMPYPIIVGAVTVPEDNQQFVPYEFTPQYSGVPTLLTTPAAGEQEDGLKEVKGLPEGLTMLGGVLVEPIGANSEPPPVSALPPFNAAPALLELERQWNVPLAQAAGISSAFVAQHSTSKRISTYTGAPRMHTFAVDGTGANMGFADGGGVDNLGVHAALRRGTQKLLVCVANNIDPRDKPSGKGADTPRCLTEDAFGREFAIDHSDVAGLFGAYPDDVSVQMGRKRTQENDTGEKSRGNDISGEEWNSYRQVFRTEQWDEVVKQAFAWSASVGKNPEGKPLMCHIKGVDVLTNRYQGIFEFKQVEIIFLFNSMADKWKATVDLANDGKEANSDEDMEKLEPSFPFISTSKLGYDARLVGCLSNLCAYNMLQIVPDVRALIG